MFTVKIKRKALRNLERLDGKRKQRVATTILMLKEDPVPFKKTDICKLRGFDSTYRIRVGDLRLVYQVQWSERTIVISFVGSREKAYR